MHHKIFAINNTLCAFNKLSNISFKSTDQTIDTIIVSTKPSLNNLLSKYRLNYTQLKKKSILDRPVYLNTATGVTINLTDVLCTNGFSYSNQVRVIRSKNTKIDSILYLTALFFDKNMPLFSCFSSYCLDQQFLNLLYNRWYILKRNILQCCPDMKPDDLLSRLLCYSTRGYSILPTLISLASESNYEISGFPPSVINFSMLRIPCDKKEFMSKVYTVIKSGGHSSAEAFIDTFVAISSTRLTEWEYILNSFLPCPSSNAPAFFDLFYNCLNNQGGANNKKALIVSFSSLYRFSDNTEKQSLFSWLTASNGVNMTVNEALEFLDACISNDSGLKSKESLFSLLTEPLRLPNTPSNTTLFTWLISPSGGGISKDSAFDLIKSCVGCVGGAKNKNSFVRCLVELIKFPNNQYLSIFNFLTSEKSCGLPNYFAISFLKKLICHSSGASSYSSFIDIVSTPLPFANSRYSTLFECFTFFDMTSEEALDLCLQLSLFRHRFNMTELYSLIYNPTNFSNQVSIVEILNKKTNMSAYFIFTFLFNYVTNQTKHKPFPPSGVASFSNICLSLRSCFLGLSPFFDKLTKSNSYVDPYVVGIFLLSSSIFHTDTHIRLVLDTKIGSLKSFINTAPIIKDLSPYILANIPFIIRSHTDLDLIISLTKKVIAQKNIVDVSSFKNIVENIFKLIILNGNDDITLTLVSHFDKLQNIIFFTDSSIIETLLYFGHYGLSDSIVYFFRNKLKIAQSILKLFPKPTHTSSCSLDGRYIFFNYLKLAQVTPSALIPLTIDTILDNSQYLVYPKTSGSGDMISKHICTQFLFLLRLPISYKSTINSTLSRPLAEHFKNFGSLLPFLKQASNCDLLYLLSVIKKLDSDPIHFAHSDFKFLLDLDYHYPFSDTTTWDDFSYTLDGDSGVQILNFSTYPTWVLAIIYLDKILNCINQKFPVTYRKNNDINFSNPVETTDRSYSFPLYSITYSDISISFPDIFSDSLHDFYQKIGISSSSLFSYNTSSSGPICKRKSPDDEVASPNKYAKLMPC